MDAYLDITLLPDPEFPPAMLMNALFGKLHRGLAGLGGQGIGVSFPDVTGTALGGRLRLHGQTADLEKLMASAWLAGMRDHVELGTVGAVPSHTGHRIVHRVQAKSNPERLRRRMVARKGVDIDEARQAIPDSAAETLRLPYLVLKSQSTGQQFRLFIEHLPVQEHPVEGTFSAYEIGRAHV